MTSRIISKDGNRLVADLSAAGHYQSQAFEEKKAVVSGAGSLGSLYAINKSTSTVYVWVFDSASASGTVLAGPFALGTGGYLSLSEPLGVPFETGVYVASSSTLATYTATATADLSISAQWMVES